MEENITIDLTEKGWNGVDWIHLAQDKDHSQALLNLQFHKIHNLLTS